MLIVRKSSLRGILVLLAGSALAAEAAAQDYTVQYSFKGGTDGGRPVGLTVDDAGNRYGMTQLGGDGCGGLFKVNTDGTFHTMWNFDGTNGANGTNGAIPVVYGPGNPSPLIVSQKTLYGATPHGGASNQGVVFSIKTDGSGFTVLHQFLGLDGSIPFGTLAVDAQGDVFGTTAYGGPYYDPSANVQGLGVLYEITANGTFITLRNFPDDGTATPSGVIFDRSGTLFGTSANAPFTNQRFGAIWRYVPLTATYTTLITGTGEAPTISAVDHADNLFGYIVGDNTNNLGELIEVANTKKGYTLVTLHSFTGEGEGLSPTGVTLSPNGVLTGVTYYGPYTGKDHSNHLGSGTIFQYSSGVFTTLYDFSYILNGVGTNPTGSPIVTTAGDIEGSTANGSSACIISGQRGHGCGVLFTYSATAAHTATSR
jgi:uncharacterized repeat protein (TIGR03803 family)